MGNHVRQQIRDAAATALTGLTTTGTRVFPSRVYQMQDAELPGLRIFTNAESVIIASMGLSRLNERTLELVVEACVKQNGTFDDVIDTSIKEVEAALAANQGIGGAKYVQLKHIEVELAGEGEASVGVGRMTFEVCYYTALGAPDVAF
jgi:hypothetical protein